MSANNWSTCPRCVAANRETQRKRLAAVQKKYGKIPAEKWEALAAEARQPMEDTESLREDYELGITNEGEFFVIYRASCEYCGFKHDFKHEQMLDVSASKNDC